uniref:Uncharacterized protein n=1 Tax=Arundo donax TaxID=35708 RepID=A0A0A9H4V4_ARUDO
MDIYPLMLRSASAVIIYIQIELKCANVAFNN